MPPPTPPYQPLLSQLWTPIVAITSTWRGQDGAQIAVSAHGASIVPDRPRILVQLYKRNLTHDLVRGSGVFALHLLAKGQEELVHRLGFVSGRRDRHKLDGLGERRGVTGCLLLDGTLGYVECRVVNAMDGGDMTCFLGDVVTGELRASGAEVPERVLWWYALRREMPEAWQREWDAKMVEELAFSAPLFDAIDRTPWQPPGGSG